MLDKISMALLNYLNKTCNDGYTVYNLTELSKIITKSEEGQSIVSESLLNLSNHDYISVKYQDDKEVCLSTLSKGRAVFENKIENEVAKMRLERAVLLYSFLGGFIGGVVGLVIYAVLTVI